MKKTNPTILIADDDGNDLMFIQRAFRAVGATSQIQTVDGGVEAIAYLNGEGKYSDRSLFAYPDFLITDLKMPEVNGFGVLEYIKRNSKAPVILAVMLSGSADDDDIGKAHSLGASAYHLKPSSPAALRILVKVLHDYWMQCEFPESKRTDTADGLHKLGARFINLCTENAAEPSAP